jgi:uncharacterized protein YbjT (DUF2867 family)
MDVLVVGAHGQVGQHITELLANSEHRALGMVRDAAQTDDIAALGAEPVVADLTESVTYAVEDCDAIVFAAGSGGEAVEAVDRNGAIRLVDAAEDAAVDRFVMLSSMYADQPAAAPESLQAYLEAKGDADRYLRGSDLTYTIVRPGELTNEPGTGKIRTAADLSRKDGDIPRVDVARTLVATLTAESTYGETFEVLSGDEPVEVALADPLHE